MSAAEQIEQAGGTAPRRDALLEEEAFIETQLTQSPAKTGARLRPLLALAPYVARYRGRAVLALISLTVAAITTLVVPVAVRRMIDFGFSPEGIALINSYFSVMIAIVAVLAAASASRYYLVMTIGEHGHAIIVGRGAARILPPEGGLSVRIVSPFERRAACPGDRETS